MRIIYVGSIYPQGMIDYYSKLKSRIDFAGHTFQTALLSGLDSICSDLKVLTIPPVSSYPSVKKLFFKQDYFSHRENGYTDDILLRCVNIPIIKLLFRTIDVYKALKKESLQCTDHIFLYAIDSPTLVALRFAKRNNVKACLLVPDLPQYMSGSKNFFYRSAKAFERRIIKWGLKSIDSYILLSKYMSEKLPIGNKPWLLMEGIYINEGTSKKITKDNKTVFLYTGTLGYRTGIMELVNAFSMLDGDNYELWIRGDGGAKNDIIRISEKDTRVRYIPPLPKEELIELQKRATFLVNPVPPSQEHTKYFFPSKTMEYLASGTPTIMYNLLCLPDEYKEHLYFFEGEGCMAIKESLEKYSRIDERELKQKGEKAAKFIKENKNAFVQAQRIKRFLSL